MTCIFEKLLNIISGCIISLIDKLSYFIFIVGIIFISDCKTPPKHENSFKHDKSGHYHVVKQDTAMIYLDSVQILIFLNQFPLNENSRKKVQSFYKTRNYAFAWINYLEISEYARNFINLLNQEEIRFRNDSIFCDNKLHSLYNILSEEDYKFGSNDSLVKTLELLLTINFFDYAKRNWEGISDEKHKKTSWFIERKKLNYENLLETLLKGDAHTISSFEPVYRQYSLLKKQLIKFKSIEKKGGWAVRFDKPKVLQKGDTSTVIFSIKEQLFMMEDLPIIDCTNFFNDQLEDAVKRFQNRHGLKENGIIEGKTLDAMSVPVHERIQQILINMERSRWVLVEQKGDYIAINIPAFKLFVYHNDSLEWSCDVIVGKSQAAKNTVIFNDNIEYVVFSPYWNIPKSILIKETLPAIKRNPNYLKAHDMEVLDASGQSVASSSIEWNHYTNNFPYLIRQKPGKNNALGLVKFYFPNSYEIYIHDTPEKSLFGETTRTFSHGCIRVAEPYKLVKFLLRDDSTMTDKKINALMSKGKQSFVKLKNKVPVFIAYFTAWVDRNGKLNFRDDVYHHDSKMKIFLFAD